jgi:hypothetical protein
VAISAPTIENTTSTMLAKTESNPLGRNRPGPDKLLTSKPVRPQADHERRAEHEEGDDRERP